MLRVGLTGGLASGKSFIGDNLARMGCYLINADKLGHQAIAPDGAAYQPVIDAFGSAILKDDGTIDRRTLGSMVFGHPERLALLNSLVHPVIFGRQEVLIEELAANDPTGIVVVEAAIMIESGSYRRHNKLIVAACSEEQQIQRAMKRDHLTRDEVLARLRSQMPLADKARLADYVIDTSGPKEDTLKQIAAVHDDLRRLANSMEH